MPRNPTRKQKLDDLMTLRYLLLTEGFSQVQAAEHLGRAPQTINRWVKQSGLREDLRQQKERQSARALKMDKSLPAFVAFVRIRFPDVHRQLQHPLEQFSKIS